MSDEHNERLITADEAKTLARHRVPSGRPLHNVTGARDLVTERIDDMPEVDWVGIFPQPTRAEPRGEFPKHDERAGRLLTGPEALAKARQRLADWIKANPDCQITERADHDGD